MGNMAEEKKGNNEISRRDFLKDASLLIGGTALGSSVLLTGCSEEKITETITQTKTQTETATDVVTQTQMQTATITTTQQIGTITETQTASKFICPFFTGSCRMAFLNFSFRGIWFKGSICSGAQYLVDP